MTACKHDLPPLTWTADPAVVVLAYEAFKGTRLRSRRITHAQHIPRELQLR